MISKPHLPPQPPLDPTQRQMAWDASQFIEQTKKSLELADEAIDLRKWCIEKSIMTPMVTGSNVTQVAQMIHDWVTQPLKTALAIAADHAKKDR